MYKALFLMTVTLTVLAGVFIYADNSECQNKCKKAYENCMNRCMVMAADNSRCLKGCEDQAKSCMVLCGENGPDDGDEPEEWKGEEPDEDAEEPESPDRGDDDDW